MQSPTAAAYLSIGLADCRDETDTEFFRAFQAEVVLIDDEESRLHPTTTSRSLRMTHGHCNCGAVRFEFSGEARGVFVCHCSICRRSTGANGIAVVVVPNDAFRWLQGQEHIARWTKPGSTWDTWFCRVCGSRLPGHNDAERMFIPVGLLPGEGLGLRVRDHIWVGSKAEWDEIGDDGRQHPQAYQGGG